MLRHSDLVTSGSPSSYPVRKARPCSHCGRRNGPRGRRWLRMGENSTC